LEMEKMLGGLKGKRRRAGKNYERTRTAVSFLHGVARLAIRTSFIRNEWKEKKAGD